MSSRVKERAGLPGDAGSHMGVKGKLVEITGKVGGS